MGTVNWDFENPSWELDPSRYISPPSSFHPTAYYYINPLSRHPLAQNLIQGGIQSWFYRTQYGYDVINLGFQFRNQSPLGTSSRANAYYVWATDLHTMQLVRVVDMNRTIVDEWYITFPLSTWTRYKLTWWNGYNKQNTPALVVRLQEWDGLQWLDKGEVYDIYNIWTWSDVNRVGLYIANPRNWADDTAIYHSLDP